MFEKFRERRREAEAQRQQAAAQKEAEKATAAWQAQRDEVAKALEIAKSEGFPADGLVLHRGESCWGTISNCSLIEERRGPGHYSGGSQGVSIPIGSLGGRSVRYRVGASRGHYVQGTPSPTAIATGTLYITDQRISFLSSSQTRDCPYAKLVGMNRDDQHGTLTLSLSNRQHPVVVSYGAGIAAWVDFRVEVGLAHFRGDIDQLIAQLTEQLAQLDAQKPPSPSA